MIAYFEECIKATRLVVHKLEVLSFTIQSNLQDNLSDLQDNLSEHYMCVGSNRDYI